MRTPGNAPRFVWRVPIRGRYIRTAVSFHLRLCYNADSKTLAGEVVEARVKKAKILIIDPDAASRATLKRMLAGGQHQVIAVPNTQQALEKLSREDFDLVISDLAATSCDDRLQLISEIGKKAHVPVIVSTSADATAVRKAFKLGAVNYLLHPYDQGELEKIVEKALAYKLRRHQIATLPPETQETIEIEMPSDIRYLDSVLSYLVERTARFGIIHPESSNMFVALDEALANAIRHGNRNDPARTVCIRAELSPKEARFTIRDEGEGFDRASVPDPLNPDNLFKTSGRGMMLIKHIMDEVHYNEQGNEITLVKFPAKASSE